MVGRPARLPDRTTAVNSGRRRRRACAGSTSGGELLATLAPTAGEDRPARAGAHPQPEAVGLRPSAVVRLERALAHEVLPLHDIGGAHPPVGGCARGGRDGRRCAASRRPRKLVTGDGTPARHLRSATARMEKAAGPSTDSRQHNRGSAGAGNPGGSRPLMIHPHGSRPVAARRNRRARASRTSVAGLWTGLLASPSLRVGRQGHGARADPVGQPTAEPSVLSPRPAADLQRCGSEPDPGRGPAASVAGRAQPVDTGVDPVRPRIHSEWLRGPPTGADGAGSSGWTDAPENR
jgi:hypothetical protein